MPRLALVIVLLCSPLVASAQMVLYATSGNGNLSQLYTVDPLTAASALIGDVLVGTTPVTVTGLSFHPGTGILFGVTGNEYSPSRRLMTIDPLTAQAVILGTIGVTSTEAASDIAFAADGTLFGWTVRGGPLVVIDSSDGVRTPIGSAMNGTGGNGLAFTPDGTLFLAGPTAEGSLYTVNPETGTLTPVIGLSNVPEGFGSINAMASDSTGVLFVTGRGSGHQLATIDRVTGVMNTVGELAFESDALAFVAIPEPSTVTLLVLGLGLFVLAMRRRRGRS